MNQQQLLVTTMNDVPGYEVAKVRHISLILSGGERISGQIRVYQPDGRTRVSDWSHEPATFRFIETEHGTLLINTPPVSVTSSVSLGLTPMPRAVS